MPTPNVDRDYLTRTLADLIRINSVNPSLAAGGRGEAEIAEYVAESLRRIGMRVRAHEPEPGRVSVVGILPGSGRGRSLMLNAHLDTVGVEGMPDPFAATVRDGKMHGRGAYDMKGSLAACMAAARALAEAGVELGGDLVVAAVADEEYASIGTADVAGRYPVDGCIVAEPTGLQICLAHKGFVWLEAEVLGRAAHGSRFEEGVDANMRMGRFVAELDRLERSLRSRPPHRLVGPPSLHLATLHGGTELSMYAASCKLQIERRTVPGETEAQVLGELQDILDGLSAADSTFRAALTTLMVRNPYEISPEAPIVSALTRAAADVLGSRPAYVGLPFWMDSALLAAAGVETAVIGPAGGGAHAIDEWVDLGSVADLARILAQTAVEYCR